MTTVHHHDADVDQWPLCCCNDVNSIFFVISLLLSLHLNIWTKKHTHETSSICMRLLPFFILFTFFFLSDTIFLRFYNDKLCEYSLPEFHRHSISMYVQRACANVVKTFAKPKEVRSLFMWRFLVIKKNNNNKTHTCTHI